MKRIIYITVSMLLAFVSWGQQVTPLNRTPYKLAVAVDKNNVYEQELKESPYVLPDNSVQMYPGEIIYLEIEQEDGDIKSVTAVKENLNPSKTIVLTFTQSAKKKVHESMMLKVVNPFKQKLVYTATIFLMKHNKWVKTDVYPVGAGLSGYETWPDIITSIGLGRWSFKS